MASCTTPWLTSSLQAAREDYAMQQPACMHVLGCQLFGIRTHRRRVQDKPGVKVSPSKASLLTYAHTLLLFGAKLFQTNDA